MSDCQFLNRNCALWNYLFAPVIIQPSELEVLRFVTFLPGLREDTFLSVSNTLFCSGLFLSTEDLFVYVASLSAKLTSLLSLEINQTRSTFYPILFLFLTSFVTTYLNSYYSHLTVPMVLHFSRLLFLCNRLYVTIYLKVASITIGVKGYNFSENNALSCKTYGLLPLDFSLSQCRLSTRISAEST